MSSLFVILKRWILGYQCTCETHKNLQGCTILCRIYTDNIQHNKVSVCIPSSVKQCHLLANSATAVCVVGHEGQLQLLEPASTF